MKAVGLLARIVGAIFVCPATVADTTHTDKIHSLQVTIDWSRSSAFLKTVPTLQVVVTPLLRRGSRVHDAALSALKELGADYVRFVPWNPYPKLAVAELEPPIEGKTSWDFSMIDPQTIDFLEATKGHSVILNFSTQPVWMFKNHKSIVYPSDANEVTWSYSYSRDEGLIDPSGRQLADYFARLFSWYTRGGFTDEYGRYHRSGYHFDVPYWEVLNEPDQEHKPTPQEYTRWYDIIVASIRKVSPKTKFVGLGLSQFGLDPEWFEFFLDHRNHQPGTPLDMISYHFYAIPGPTETIDQWQYSFFSQVDTFVSQVRFIELIRKRLSPSTRSAIDEVGSILPNDAASATPAPIPDAYWNLSAATYAYLFIKLSTLGIDVLNESALIQSPSQFPDVTMVNWTNGKPNARYWVLKLLKERLTPGDEVYTAGVVDLTPGDQTFLHTVRVVAQGYRSMRGERKILLVNQAQSTISARLGPTGVGARVEVVDQRTGEGPPRMSTLDAEAITLAPFAVAVVTLH
jgi:hypothetical protein